MNNKQPTLKIKDNEQTDANTQPKNKVGTFAVIFTPQTKGQRYNLEKVRTYGKSDDTVVTLVWDNGLKSDLTLPTKEEADAIISTLDEYCL